MTVPVFNQCTIFSKGQRDPMTGLYSWGERRVYQCEYMRGGKTKLADSSGAEYYPSSKFWVRAGDIIEGTHQEPKEGDMILQGNAAEANGEVVRSVTVYDNACFVEPDSYMIGVST